MTNFEDLYLTSGRLEEQVSKELAEEKERGRISSCEICHQHKDVSVHCVYILPECQTSLVDVVCQYVCNDCVTVLHQKEHGNK